MGTQFVQYPDAAISPNVNIASLDVKDSRIHDISATNINGSAGAFVQFAGPAGLAAAIKQLEVSYTFGEPLDFRVAANAGAAAAAPVKFYLNQGDGPVNLQIAFNAGDKIWVRSASVTAANAGYITINFMG